MESQTLEDTGQCSRCDGPGNEKTYANQALMPLDGRVRCIDWCIHHIIAALNAGGVKTLSCCCGHQEMPGQIYLEDGRMLLVMPSDVSDDALHLLWQALEQKKQPSELS